MPKLSLNRIKRSNRHRVVLNLPARVGLKNGTVVDVSETGILVTHTGTLKAGTVITIDFTVEGKRFSASGRVESCTVVGFGADADDTGATVYASRIFFVTLTPESRLLLEALMKG